MPNVEGLFHQKGTSGAKSHLPYFHGAMIEEQVWLSEIKGWETKSRTIVHVSHFRENKRKTMLRYVTAPELLFLPVLNIHSQVSCLDWDNFVFPEFSLAPLCNMFSFLPEQDSSFLILSTHVLHYMFFGEIYTSGKEDSCKRNPLAPWNFPMRNEKCETHPWP